MIRGMAWCVDGLEEPACTRDPFAIAKRDVRNEIPIPAFLDRRLTAMAAGMRAESVCRRAGRRLQRSRRRRMIAMRVGDQDVGNPVAHETSEECLDMLEKIGARIDHRDRALADHIGSGAPECE